MGDLAIPSQTLRDDARRLLSSLDEGAMSATAYDTAWVGRVPNPGNPDEPLFPTAYDWLLRRQRPDGSWGAEIPFGHDRVVATLAGLITLSKSAYRPDQSQIAARRALVYLNRTKFDLREELAETVAFELILPELIRQAKALALSLPYDDWVFVEEIRTAKLKGIPPIALYGGPTPLTHSLEYLGERLALSLASRCRLVDGSYGVSPSATAYVHTLVPTADTEGYLQRVAALDPTGGVPYVHPFETFETGWILNLLGSLVRPLPEASHLVDRLAERWSDDGLTWTAESSVPDADDTAVAISVLSRYGRAVDPGVLEAFETPDCFRTFTFERNSSVTTNAHVLEALRRVPSTAARRRMTLKSVRYLRETQTEQGCWYDKWHASPFYATDQAVLALRGLAGDLVRSAIRWTLDQQHESGAWGLGDGTVEETAWAVHTLAVGGRGDDSLRPLTADALCRGLRYLAERYHEQDYPALWIGKTLYSPVNIVRAVVLAALEEGQTVLERAA